MQISTEPLELVLSTPFRIAHGTSTTRNNVLVHVDDGVGVAAITPYYPAQVEDVVAYVSRPDVQAVLNKGHVRYLDELIAALPAGPAPAIAALDLALHDLWGKQLNQPLYRLWGLNPASAPFSTFTIGMAEEDEFRQKVRDASNYPQIKIKLGSGSLDTDESLVRIAREETDATLCVDANSAWTVEESAAIIPRLAEYGMMFIEQPLAQENISGWKDLQKLLPADMPPLIADEAIHNSNDILPLAGGADGINIKLAKCGGLREARKMIAVARSLGMQTMLGCMVESTVGVTAAAHLMPLVDFADLDGNLTVTNDPYTGAQWQDGRLIHTKEPGLGVSRL